MSTNPSSAGQSATYFIRIQGHLDAQWSEWFGNVEIKLEENGETLIICIEMDQAGLYGLLKRIRNLGLPLLSLERVSADQEGSVDTS